MGAHGGSGWLWSAGIARGHGVLWSGEPWVGSGWIWDDLGLRGPGAPVEVKLDVRCCRVLKGLRGWGCQSRCGGSAVTGVWGRGLWGNGGYSGAEEGQGSTCSAVRKPEGQKGSEVL